LTQDSGVIMSAFSECCAISVSVCVS